MSSGNSKGGVSEVFRESIKLWVQLTNQKAEVMKDMKLINDKLKELKAYITQYMSTSKLDGCNVHGSRVTLSVSKTKEPLNRDVLSRLITEYHKGNSQESGALADHILNNRATKETYGLRKAKIPGYSLSMRDESMSHRVGGGGNPVKDTACSSAVNASVLKIIDDTFQEHIEDNESHFIDEDDA